MSVKKASQLPDSSRRVFVKKMAYVAPTLLTFSAVASMAQPGSCPGGDTCVG